MSAHTQFVGEQLFWGTIVRDSFELAYHMQQGGLLNPVIGLVSSQNLVLLDPWSKI